MRGFWHTLEAIISVIIVLTILLFLSSGLKSESAPAIAQQAFEALEELDRTGDLRQSAAAFDYESIGSEINLPFTFSVQVCDFSGRCDGQRLGGGNVASAAYIIAGHASYSPREVRLYVSQ